MIEFSDIKGKYIGNKNLINNVLGSFLVRGFGFLVSFALFPLYLNYFDDNTVLGCWFTMCSVLSWIQWNRQWLAESFDGRFEFEKL